MAPISRYTFLSYSLGIPFHFKSLFLPLYIFSMPQANEILLIIIAWQIYHIMLILHSINQQVPPWVKWHDHPVGGMKDPPPAFRKLEVGPRSCFSDIPRLYALYD